MYKLHCKPNFVRNMNGFKWMFEWCGRWYIQSTWCERLTYLYHCIDPAANAQNLNETKKQTVVSSFWSISLLNRTDSPGMTIQSNQYVIFIANTLHMYLDFTSIWFGSEYADRGTRYRPSSTSSARVAILMLASSRQRSTSSVIGWVVAGGVA